MSRIAPAEVLAVFKQQECPGTPLSAPEVAEVLGCARRTAHKKLTQLAEQNALATKKVGARGRVWWLPGPRRAEIPTQSDQTERPVDQSGTITQEQALRELHDATRRLIRTESREPVCDIAVHAAQDIIGLSLCGLWLYTPDREVLEPAAWTPSGVEEYGTPPDFPLEGSLAGQVFREGDYRVYEDITTVDDLFNPETAVRSELILSLGEYGVLNASSTEVGAFDEVDVSLARVLAANVQTALQRVEQLAERRARRRKLERQREELATLNQINALVENIVGVLVEAATRTEIEETVCEQLAGSNVYLDAWIGERGSSTQGVVLRTGVGDESDLRDSVPETDGGLPSPNPVETAIEENTIQVIQSLQDDERISDQLRTAALPNGARACIAVPLASADTVFGALVVYKSTPHSVSDREQTAFATLGQVVGFVINATNNRQLLLGTTAVELDVNVRNPDTWFLAAAERLDATILVDGVVPTDTETVIEYVTVQDAATDCVPAALRDMPALVDVSVLATEPTRVFLQCTVREEAAELRALTEYGATIQTAKATGGTGRITTRFPEATSPRDAMTVLEDAFPRAELVAKRVVDNSDRSVSRISEMVADRLTDKQQTALRAAFLAGYYDSPRETTAEELAESLDIAPSTLYQHLQAAHRKLLRTVFNP